MSVCCALSGRRRCPYPYTQFPVSLFPVYLVVCFTKLREIICTFPHLIRNILRQSTCLFSWNNILGRNTYIFSLNVFKFRFNFHVVSVILLEFHSIECIKKTLFHLNTVWSDEQKHVMPLNHWFSKLKTLNFRDFDWLQNSPIHVQN